LKIEESKQEELLFEDKKLGENGKVKSTSQAPLVTFYETVSLRIKTELMSVRECERLKRITARDTRIIRDYLRIINHNEEKILKKDGKVNISLLDKLTLTTSKKNENEIRSSVPHDLKKRYPRCSHDEFQECSSKAISTYESWKAKQDVSKKELSRPEFKKKTPRPMFKGTGSRGTIKVHSEPENTEAILWLDIRDSLDTRRSDERTDSKKSGTKNHNRLWLPLAFSPYHEKKLKPENIKKVELIHKSKEQQWWAHFTLMYSVPSYHSTNPPAVLGVDLGIKKTAVAVLLTPTGKVIMDELRFIVNKERQSKIWQLEKQIGDTQRKLNKSLNNGQHTEQLNATLFLLRKRLRSVTEQELGHAVNQLVDFILQLKKSYNLFVAVGYPKNIRKSQPLGSGNKSHRRRLHKWCYRLFTTKLKYKLKHHGFESHRVVAVNESWTSQTCSRCNSTNTTRTGQGQFNCHDCNYELDADLNGAKNIGKRLIKYALKTTFNFIFDTLTEECHTLLHYNCFEPLGQWLE